MARSGRWGGAVLAAWMALSVPVAAGAGERLLTDMAGRRVAVPAALDRIACLTGACYEKLFLLGAADKVVLRLAGQPPWMAATNPRVATIPVTHDPNVEDVLARGAQLAFVFTRHLARLERTGLPLLVPDAVSRADITTAEAFLDTLKRELRLYGEALAAEERAQAWCAYLDARVAAISARLASQPTAVRPKVYFLRGPDALTTHGADSNIRWLGEIAGADMGLSAATAAGISRVDMEQIAAVNPDIILVGRQYPIALVTDDPRWKDIRAVRQGRVYPVPDGVFFWDSSSEGVLLLQFIAKIVHPDLFADLDLGAAVSDYYHRFYGVDLSDGQLALLLAGRGPDGRRVNPAGN